MLQFNQSTTGPITTAPPAQQQDKTVLIFQRGQQYLERTPFVKWRTDGVVPTGWIALPALRPPAGSVAGAQVTHASFTYQLRANGIWLITRPGASGSQQPHGTADGGLTRFYDVRFRYDATDGLRWTATPLTSLQAAQRPAIRAGTANYYGPGVLFLAWAGASLGRVPPGRGRFDGYPEA